MTCTSPPPPSSSMWKLVTTTISVGLTMFAKCGLISELRYSMSRRATCDHASFRSREHVLEQHVNDAILGRRELAAFDLGEAAVAAEEVVDGREHELRIEHDEPSAAQRQDLHQVEIRRHVQRVHVVAELQHLDRRNGDLRRAAAAC